MEELRLGNFCIVPWQVDEAFGGGQDSRVELGAGIPTLEKDGEGAVMGSKWEQC